MWDVRKYKGIIDTIKKDGTFLGSDISSKEDIYKLIAERLFVDTETAKSWTRPTSNGPGSDNVIAELENLLGIPEGELGRRENKQDMNNEKQHMGLSDYNKEAIHKCYILMKTYLHDDDVEDEDCFSKMYEEVEKNRIAIPAEIYIQIKECIDELLAPIVYEHDDVFYRCYTDDLGHVGDDGSFHINDEEALKKTIMYHMMTLVEIEEKVDQFAMEHLYPVMVG